jgi:hypothetical protein
MRILISAILLSIFITGCQTTVKSIADLANAATASDMIMSGGVSGTINSVVLNDAESLTVTHAINRYSIFIEKWKNSIAGIDVTGQLFNDFLLDYAEIVKQYKAIDAIVRSHWGGYDAISQQILLDYQRRAIRINESVDALIAARRRHQALLDAVGFVNVLTGIAKTL